ncbi:FKBP-type peptidyl-prolyl cis-trans isomerase SlyD [hydrothermal vent metagenome]|uniref:peptidylprolyl isomerase n=1 Tax=hydrothermal vent metagenome TaxID=652676 RepID=A0A3B0T3P8_9ZZZZ
MRYRLLLLLAVLGLVAAACSGSPDAADAPTTTEGQATETTTTVGTSDTEADSAAPTAQDSDLVVQDGDIVEVHYVGTLDDGSQFDSSRDRGTPFSFTVGTGQVISGFDEAVRGAKVGDINTVRMEAADAYGEWSEANIIEVPFNPDQGDVAVGDEVFLTNGQPATVLEVTDETVTLDANHPLAGQALTFEIEVLSITRG